MSEQSVLPNEDLRSRLRDIDQSLESIYLGAYYALNDPQNPERISQSAHSIRELTVGLFRPENEERKDSLVNKIQKKINLYDNIPPFYLKGYSRFNNKIHAYFLKIAHHGPQPTIEEFRRKIIEYEQELLKILEDYFDCFLYVKGVISNNKPLEEDIPKLVSKLKFSSLIRYFFNNVSEDWLQTLKQYGFFKQPIGLNTDGYFPIWFESQYLVRISNSKKLSTNIFYEIIRECKISRDIKNRNYRIIEDFIQIALNVDFKTCRKIIDFLINNQLLKQAPIEGIKTTQLLMQIFKRYLSNNDFSHLIFKFILEIKTVKKIHGRKRSKDNLIDEYNAFIINPLTNTMYEEFNDFINELQNISKTYPKHNGTMIRLVFEILLDLVDKYLVIERFSNRQAKPLILFETKMVSSIPLFNMQKSYIQNQIKEFYEIDVAIYSFLHNLLLENLEKSSELIGFVKSDILPRVKYIPLRKLFLSICMKIPQPFKKEINNLLFKYIEDVDVSYEYYGLVKKSFPFLDQKIKDRYVKKAIGIRKNLNLSKSGNDFFIPNMIKFFNLYEPILNSLPNEEVKFYDDCREQHPELVISGYLGKTTLHQTSERIPELKFENLIGMLKSENTNEYDTMVIRENLDDHLERFCQSLNDLKIFNSIHYPLIFQELVRHYSNERIDLQVIFNFIDRFNETQIHSDFMYKLFIAFLHRIVNPKILNPQNKKKIYEIIKNIGPKDNGFLVRYDINTMSIETFSNSTSFVYWALVLKICNYLFISSTRKNLFKRLVENTLAVSSDRDQTIKLSILAYFQTLLKIDEKIIINNIDVLLPEYQTTNKNIYFISWYLLIAENSFSDRLVIIIDEKFRRHLSVLKQIGLKKDHDHYKHLIDTIVDSYRLGYQDSRLLIDGLLENFPEVQKYNFIRRLASVLKDSVRDQISLDLSILYYLIDDPRLQNCGEFYRWIMYSPFDKEYTLKLLLKLLKTTSIDITKHFYYLLLDDIIYYLKDFIIGNESDVLDSIHLILKKLTHHKLYINRNKVYRSLELIGERVKNFSQFNKIIQMLLIAGYDEFLTLKI